MTFVTQYDRDGDKFLDHNLTDDKTWSFVKLQKPIATLWNGFISDLHDNQKNGNTSVQYMTKSDGDYVLERKEHALIDFSPRGKAVNSKAFYQIIHQI